MISRRQYYCREYYCLMQRCWLDAKGVSHVPPQSVAVVLVLAESEIRTNLIFDHCHCCVRYNLPLRLIRILVMLREVVRLRGALALFPMAGSVLMCTIDCWLLAGSAYLCPAVQSRIKRNYEKRILDDFGNGSVRIKYLSTGSSLIGQLLFSFEFCVGRR